MCMFSKPVNSVASTKLLVIDNGPKQVTVYSNKVDLKDGKPTAMILPVPCNDASAELCGIRVYDLTACIGLMSTLDSMFMDRSPSLQSARGSRSRSALGPPIEVLRSGSYRYSVVPALADFARLQHEVFGVDPSSDLGTLLSKHYATGFAFMVCIIDATAAFAPIAYEHDKHTSGRVFVPTRHFHGSTRPAGRGPEIEDHWDHTVVSVGCMDQSVRSVCILPRDFHQRFSCRECTLLLFAHTVGFIFTFSPLHLVYIFRVALATVAMLQTLTSNPECRDRVPVPCRRPLDPCRCAVF
jgi:hypothetical protein